MTADANRERRAAFVMLLRSHGVRDTRVLSAFERVPRHVFVGDALAGKANRDSPLPLPCGQTMERPSAAAKILEALRIEKQHRVLEVGAGSGWLTAVLAGLAAHVTAVERYAELAAEGKKRLKKLNIGHAHIVHGDAQEEAGEGAPFDRIFLNAAVEQVPQALADRLKPGGVLVAPIGPVKGQQLTRFTKAVEGLQAESLWPVKAVPLQGGRAVYL